VVVVVVDAVPWVWVDVDVVDVGVEGLELHDARSAAAARTAKRRTAGTATGRIANTDCRRRT
jgi:hypothetical protein